MPHYLPDGGGVVFTVVSSSNSVGVLSFDTMQWESVLVPGFGYDVSYIPTGHLIFTQTAQVTATPFDLESLSTVGNNVGILTDVLGGPVTGFVYSIASNGTLSYVPRPLREALVWVDREGDVEPLGIPAGHYRIPRLSPGGDRVAVRREDRALLVTDIASGVPTKIADRILSFLWMDSRSLVFAQNTSGSMNLYSIDATGGGQAQEILNQEFSQQPESWLPEKRLLAYGNVHPDTGADIWLLSVDDDKTELLVQTAGSDRFAQFSPDGNWVAYTSDESGRDQVFVCALLDCVGDLHTVDFGIEPLWSPDGRELFYRNGNQIWATEITDPSTMTFGERVRLFDGPFRYPDSTFRSYDLHPDGDRFLMISDPSDDEIRVILNWDEELKEKVPVP